jgi:SAM-dependent methyltransferase
MDIELWPYEISHANHRTLDPLSENKLVLLGQAAHLSAGQRLLDLGCGRGEMLCRWAQTHGIGGLGIDLSVPQIDDARARAAQLEVQDRVAFEQGDAGQATWEPGTFDVAACIGATWIGGGPAGTIELMRPALREEGGLLMVGEPFWKAEPTEQACEALGFGPDDYTDLSGMLDCFEQADVELVEMVLSDQDSWDRYEAQQWWTTDEWLRANPDDPRAPRMRDFLTTNRRTYLQHQRHLLDWGVFVLRPRA